MSDLVVYKCVVCGKAFTKLQSLMAHMRVHRDVEWARLSVRLPKKMVDEFKALAKRHNTTTCQLIHSLLTSLIEGEKRGIVTIGSQNPIVINLVNVFGGAPRGHKKWSLRGLAGFEPPRCFICGSPAVVACSNTEANEVYLCKKHSYYKREFEIYRYL